MPGPLEIFESGVLATSSGRASPPASALAVPATPETYHLMALMASHDFQTALQNYLDLEDLRSRLITWKTGLGAFDDIIRLRRQYYEPLLPGIDNRFRELDTQIRLRMEQRDRIDRRLKDMLVAPRPEFLATAEEQAVAAQVADLQRRLAGAEGADAEQLQLRLARLEGEARIGDREICKARIVLGIIDRASLRSELEALTRP